jgi:hypothetical protein
MAGVSWPRWPELGRLGGQRSSRFTATALVIERGECVKLRQGRVGAIGLYRRGREEGTRRTCCARGRARAGWANAGVPTRVEHVCALLLPEFWRE